MFQGVITFCLGEITVIFMMSIILYIMFQGVITFCLGMITSSFFYDEYIMFQGGYICNTDCVGLLP